MDLFDPLGYAIYLVSTLAAFITGCIPVLFLVGAAAFGAPSKLWIGTFSSVVIIWSLCYLVPLLMIASRRRFVPIIAVLGSCGAVLYCVAGIYAVLQSDDKAPLSIGGLAAPVWVWLTIPILFNLGQFGLSISRLQQLRIPEVTP